MNDVILLYGKKWEFDFYKSGDDFIITIVFSEYNNFSQMDVFRSFRLSDDEIQKLCFCSDVELLAGELKKEYPNNKDKEIIPYLLLPARKSVMKYSQPDDKILEIPC
ncbi:hypothetical protein AAGR22_03605 [Erwinia sp. HDF1-3R]|uniref:hypothetical protein n=1 Tax=Erwinia sp. HDF1-3R TaxID=3141543 RepID=UPI0031F4ED8F